MPSVSAKVSDHEKIEFQNIAKSKNTTVSKMIKMAIRNAVIKDQSIDLMQINELKRLDNNLNQVMPYLHVRKSLDRQTFYAIQEIKKHIKTLL